VLALVAQHPRNEQIVLERRSLAPEEL